MVIIGYSGLHDSVRFKKENYPDLDSRAYRIAQGFDSAASMVTDKGVFAVAEERFTREKATGDFPVHAINYCLEQNDISIEDVDYFAHSFCYEPLKEFYNSEKIKSKQFEQVYSIESQLKKFDEYFGEGVVTKEKIIQVPHHLSHAASTYYMSGYENSLIYVSDGMGESTSATIAIGSKNGIEVISEISSLHSLGVFYSVFTLYLGFKFSMDEYKIMGLAPYGDPRVYFDEVMSLVRLNNDGTYSIPFLQKNISNEEKETYSGSLKVLEEIFGLMRKPNSDMLEKHMNIAASVQNVAQVCILHTLKHFRRKTGLKNLCMAGGVALNCTANGHIQRSKMFENIFIQPASGDDGASIGACLWAKNKFDQIENTKQMTMPYWGPEYSNNEYKNTLTKSGYTDWIMFDTYEELVSKTALLLQDGLVIGWFQGRMEFGPRALGNRSIIADPSKPDMQSKINLMIKKREGFRPFAPIVHSEKASKYFEVDGRESEFRHMLFTTKIKAGYINEFPAINHVDNSARVQTLTKNDNKLFWMLLEAFEKRSGHPILLNTSFNTQEPVVCSPSDAIKTFEDAGLDALVMGKYLLVRK